MCGILCCFGCLTCLGLRDKVCQRLVYFPPPPMYVVDEKKNPDDYQTLWLLDEQGTKCQPYSSPNLSIDFVKTKKKNMIATMFLAYPQARVTIMFSHGNATDIGAMRDHLLDMSTRLKVNIYTYDYSGYGLSSGSPSPSRTLADSEAAFQHLVRKFIVDSNHQIILYGQSLGSGPTMHLALKYENQVSGVILHSGMMSALRVIQNLTKTKWFDIFVNIDKVRMTSVPVFVIHGTQDQEIPVHHGIELSEAAKHPYEPWIVSGAGHNNIELHWRNEYFEKLRDFIRFLQKDVANLQYKHRETNSQQLITVSSSSSPSSSSSLSAKKHKKFFKDDNSQQAELALILQSKSTPPASIDDLQQAHPDNKAHENALHHVQHHNDEDDENDQDDDDDEQSSDMNAKH